MRIVIIMILCGLTLGCATASEPRLTAASVSAVQKSVALSEAEISPEEEYLIGRAVAARILGAYKPYVNEAATEYINLIGNALALNSASPEIYGGYHFLILDTADIDTFSAPGGFVFITRGILGLAEDEDMVACILAYSISHIVMHSGLQSIREARRVDALVMAADTAAQSSDTADLKNMAGEIAKRSALSNINRRQVLVADRMAIELARKTGYDPKALRDILMLLPTKAEANESPQATMFPSIEDRLKAIDNVLKVVRIPRANAADLIARQKRFEEALDGIRKRPQ